MPFSWPTVGYKGFDGSRVLFTRALKRGIPLERLMLNGVKLKLSTGLAPCTKVTKAVVKRNFRVREESMMPILRNAVP
jgi:hypothetical protein